MSTSLFACLFTLLCDFFLNIYDSVIRTEKQSGREHSGCVALLAAQLYMAERSVKPGNVRWRSNKSFNQLCTLPLVDRSIGLVIFIWIHFS